MSAVGAKYVIQRFQPSIYGEMGSDGAVPMTPKGKGQTYDEWRDVVTAADTIVGDNNLQMGVPATDPVVIRQGDDVVLIYMKLEI